MVNHATAVLFSKAKFEEFAGDREMATAPQVLRLTNCRFDHVDPFPQTF